MAQNRCVVAPSDGSKRHILFILHVWDSRCGTWMWFRVFNWKIYIITQCRARRNFILKCYQGIQTITSAKQSGISTKVSWIAESLVLSPISYNTFHFSSDWFWTAGHYIHCRGWNSTGPGARAEAPRKCIGPPDCLSRGPDWPLKILRQMLNMDSKIIQNYVCFTNEHSQ